MPNFYCCALKCTSDIRKRKKLDKYPWMKTITFHAFPTKMKQNELRQKWLAMVNRENWEPNRYARLCSIHFVGLKGPTEQHPIPTLFDYNDYGGMLRCKSAAAYQADGTTAKGKSNVIILITCNYMEKYTQNLM